ncbi:hypothetical protein EZV62_021805 [Acer yangbiense]|uniref:Uncharacterized protein n=1 Tax=Acer yangbiense TaxID=1000413 RepID=A0A5C7H929_9ROSI|nr:hypothetical protein EZV62_021805 [Acer yangbiense]
MDSSWESDSRKNSPVPNLNQERFRGIFSELDEEGSDEKKNTSVTGVSVAADRWESGLSPPRPESPGGAGEKTPGVRCPDPTPSTTKREVPVAASGFVFHRRFRPVDRCCSAQAGEKSRRLNRLSGKFAKYPYLMQLLFEYQELWTVVSDGIVRPADAATTRKDLKDWSSGKGSSLDVNVDLEEIVQEEPTLVIPPPGVTPHPAESSSCPQRQRVLPAHCDPITYEDVVRDDCWMKAMDEEIGAIEKNNT